MTESPKNAGKAPKEPSSTKTEPGRTEPGRTASGAFALDRRFVTDLEIFEREQAEIFSQHWICVGRTSELDVDGKCFTAEFGSHRLLVLRDQPSTDNSPLRCCYNV